MECWDAPYKSGSIVVSGQEKEYQIIQTFFDGCLKIRSAFVKLGINGEVFLSMCSGEFEYITRVIELTNEHNFSKYYCRVDKDSFTLGGVLVKRGL